MLPRLMVGPLNKLGHVRDIVSHSCERIKLSNCFSRPVAIETWSRKPENLATFGHVLAMLTFKHYHTSDKKRSNRTSRFRGNLVNTNPRPAAARSALRHLKNLEESGLLGGLQLHAWLVGCGLHVCGVLQIRLIRLHSRNTGNPLSDDQEILRNPDVRSQKTSVQGSP